MYQCGMIFSKLDPPLPPQKKRRTPHNSNSSPVLVDIRGRPLLVEARDKLAMTNHTQAELRRVRPAARGVMRMQRWWEAGAPGDRDQKEGFMDAMIGQNRIQEASRNPLVDSFSTETP